MALNIQPGDRFGRLVIIGPKERRAKTHDFFWLTECDCGTRKYISQSRMRSGKTRSCGCYRREQMTTHGCTTKNARLYDIWHSMKERCQNPNSVGYKYYGEKGIKVCDDWINNVHSFFNWSYANGYEDNLTIDREDNDGDYEPSNCRWISITEQNRNRSSTVLTKEIVKEIRSMYVNGIKVPDIARTLNLNRRTLNDVVNKKTWA